MTYPRGVAVMSAPVARRRATSPTTICRLTENRSAKTPATVCLAIPLYEQLELLKHNWKAIVLGILSGVLASLGSILGMAVLFGMSHEEYVTFLPKSIL